MYGLWLHSHRQMATLSTYWYAIIRNLLPYSYIFKLHYHVHRGLCVVKLGFINDSMQTNYNRPVAAAKATYIECACCVKIWNQYCASHAGSLHSYSLYHDLTGKHLMKGSKGNAKMDLEGDFKAGFLSTCEVWKPYWLCTCRITPLLFQIKS